MVKDGQIFGNRPCPTEEYGAVSTLTAIASRRAFEYLPDDFLLY